MKNSPKEVLSTVLLLAGSILFGGALLTTALSSFNVEFLYSEAPTIVAVGSWGLLMAIVGFMMSSKY